MSSSMERALRRLDYSWVILATGFVVLFFSGGSRFAFGLMLKPMTEDLGWSRSLLSLAITLFMVVSALSQPVVGRLADRYGLRWIIAGGALATALGIGLMAIVRSPWQVFVLYGLIYAAGNAAASITPIGVMIGQWFVRRRGIANSAAISGTGTGQLVIIMLLASSLATLGWRKSFALLGAANLAIVAPLVLATVKPKLRPETDAGDHPRVEAMPPASADSPAPLSSILTSRQLWVLIAVYAVCGIQDFFVATHVVAFALDQGVGPVLAGNMLALMGLTGLAGVLLAGLLSDAFGASRPTLLCFVVRIGIFAFVLYFQDTAGILAFALLYGFTFFITAPLTVVFAGNLFGQARLGTVSGIISMVHSISGGLGAFIGALIFDSWGSYEPAFALMLGLSLVATAATLVVKDRPLAQAAPRP